RYTKGISRAATPKPITDAAVTRKLFARTSVKALVRPGVLGARGASTAFRAAATAALRKKSVEMRLSASGG
ncbi:unnamed protein product, partial [Prorocentrum cordatum]